MDDEELDAEHAEVSRPFHLALMEDFSDDSISAEELAHEIEGRARKRRRTEREGNSPLDGNHATCALFPEGLEVDDSRYEMYYVRVRSMHIQVAQES